MSVQLGPIGRDYVHLSDTFRSPPLCFRIGFRSNQLHFPLAMLCTKVIGLDLYPLNSRNIGVFCTADFPPHLLLPTETRRGRVSFSHLEMELAF